MIHQNYSLSLSWSIDLCPTFTTVDISWHSGILQSRNSLNMLKRLIYKVTHLGSWYKSTFLYKHIIFETILPSLWYKYPNFEVNVNNFSRLDVRHFDTWYGLLIKYEMTIGGNFKIFFFFLVPPPFLWDVWADWISHSYFINIFYSLCHLKRGSKFFIREEGCGFRGERNLNWKYP